MAALIAKSFSRCRAWSWCLPSNINTTALFVHSSRLCAAPVRSHTHLFGYGLSQPKSVGPSKTTASPAGTIKASAVVTRFPSTEIPTCVRYSNPISFSRRFNNSLIRVSIGDSAPGSLNSHKDLNSSLLQCRATYSSAASTDANPTPPSPAAKFRRTASITCTWHTVFFHGSNSGGTSHSAVCTYLTSRSMALMMSANATTGRVAGMGSAVAAPTIPATSVPGTHSLNSESGLPPR